MSSDKKQLDEKGKEEEEQQQRQNLAGLSRNDWTAKRAALGEEIGVKETPSTTTKGATTAATAAGAGLSHGNDWERSSGRSSRALLLLLVLLVRLKKKKKNPTVNMLPRRSAACATVRAPLLQLPLKRPHQGIAPFPI